MLDEESSVTTSVAEHQLFLKWNMNFTYGIWKNSDKLKSTNYNWKTLHSENTMNRVLHERNNVAS